MPFTLAEFAKIEKDTLRKSVLNTLLMEIKVGDKAPWETIGALSTKIVRYQDLPSIGFRKLNEGYAEGTGHLEQKAIERAKNTIGGTARGIQQDMALLGMAYKFNDKFINGNTAVDPEEFNGLATRINALVLEGFTGQYIDNAGTAGDGMNLSTAERHNFLDHLDQLIYSIKGHKCDALRRETLLSHAADQFGRMIDLYRGIPMLDMGVKADQTTEIITSTETLEDEALEESTSIYAMRFGIGQFLWGIQEYPLETDDKGLLEDKPVYRTEVDWPLGLAQADPYSIARLYGIIPNASN